MQCSRFLHRVAAKEDADRTREADGNDHHKRRDGRLPSREVREHLRARDAEDETAHHDTLDEELYQHVRAAYAEREANADFTRALGDRDQRDEHHALGVSLHPPAGARDLCFIRAWTRMPATTKTANSNGSA